MTAVCLMDSALNHNLMTVRDLQRAHDFARGHPGVARTHPWWDEADRRADSPAETVARLRCSDAGYPPDALQLTIRDRSGRTLARVELAWLLPDGRWLLAEIDGIDVHGTPRGVIADLHRQNPLITSATVLRRYTGADAMTGRLAAEVGSILQASRWRPGMAANFVGPLVLSGAAGTLRVAHGGPAVRGQARRMTYLAPASGPWGWQHDVRRLDRRTQDNSGNVTCMMCSTGPGTMPNSTVRSRQIAMTISVVVAGTTITTLVCEPPGGGSEKYIITTSRR